MSIVISITSENMNVKISALKQSNAWNLICTEKNDLPIHNGEMIYNIFLKKCT